MSRYSILHVEKRKRKALSSSYYTCGVTNVRTYLAHSFLNDSPDTRPDPGTPTRPGLLQLMLLMLLTSWIIGLDQIKVTAAG